MNPYQWEKTLHLLSEKLNISWGEITNNNIFWFKHKCDFVSHLNREENQKIQTAKMRGLNK